MMETIRQYLLSVVTASMISAAAVAVTGKNHTLSAVTKLLAGLFLAITVVSPWTDFSVDGLAGYWESMDMEASGVAAYGEAMANDAKAAIIKERTQAYILDKATALGLRIDAQVELLDTFEPASVVLSGKASPYARAQLQQYIADELGIPKEKQSWM